jgi:hypothetical protein
MKTERIADTQEGKITRVDMRVRVDGAVSVIKYADGWTSGSAAADVHVNADTPITEMIAWFKAHGWTVHTWGDVDGAPIGARAWLGPALPVRNKYQIIALRGQMESMLRQFGGKHPHGLQIHAMDFSVDM